jgi:hypothetical protein
MSNKMKLLPLLAVLVGVGCSDAATTTIAPRALSPAIANSAFFGRTPEKFAAAGTSISMGWCSNGVYIGCQLTSWPALIGFGTLQPITLPLIQSPGCTSPLVAPLASGLRLSGESVAVPATICAPNVQGVTLPTQNVALAAALAADAVMTTPQTPGAPPFYARVLGTGMTQLTALLSQRPTIISYEFGVNEVLNATSGLIAPGVTVVPFPYFAQPYDAGLDAIGSTRAKVVLAGLPKDGSNLPVLRKGSEIWNDRAEFAALHVDVSSDCKDSPNYINVPIKSLNMVFTAAFTFANGLPNPVYSCADIPGTQDLVLTPADIVVLNGMLAQMDEHIRQQAQARGYAYFSLGALYDRPDLKQAPYSIINHLTSKTPFGYLISLDGAHPSALGSAVIAGAAAFAYNAKYSGNDVAVRGAQANVIAPASLSLADQLEEEELPAVKLARAQQIAAANAGRKLSACAMPVRGLSGCQ